MGNRPDILTNCNDTYRESHVDAHAFCLVNDLTDQENKDSAGLISFDQFGCLFICWCFINDNNESRNITGDQRHTQFTDFRIAEMAMIWCSFIWSRCFHIFTCFNDLSCHRSRNAGIEDRSRRLDVLDHVLHVFQCGLKIRYL